MKKPHINKKTVASVAKISAAAGVFATSFYVASNTLHADIMYEQYAATVGNGSCSISKPNDK